MSLKDQMRDQLLDLLVEKVDQIQVRLDSMGSKEGFAQSPEYRELREMIFEMRGEVRALSNKAGAANISVQGGSAIGGNVTGDVAGSMKKGK